MSWEGARQAYLASGLSFGSRTEEDAPKDPTIAFFYCLIAVHALIWSVLPAIAQPNAPERTLELLASGREIAWGYETQPPLAVWLASLVAWFTAPAVWPVYVLSQICCAVTVWAVWRFARDFLHPWTALCAAIVFAGGYSVTMQAADFSATQLGGSFWALAILAFHRALTQSRRRLWIALGVCLALGILTAYGTILLLLAMVVFTAWDPRARRCWDSSWPFLALATMGVILLPHFFWLAQNDFVTVQHAWVDDSTDRLSHLTEFLFVQLLATIPILLLLAPLIAVFDLKESTTDVEDDREFARRYLVWITCLPAAIIAALSLTAGPAALMFSNVSPWMFLGLAFLLWSHLQEERDTWRHVILRTGTSAGFFAALLIAANVMVPHLRKQPASTLFPGKQLASHVQSAWREAGYQGPIPVVTGPAELVHNATWYSGNAVERLDRQLLEPGQVSTQSDKLIRSQGGVILWKADESSRVTFEDLQRRYGNVAPLPPVTLEWQSKSGIPGIQVQMAVVHPAVRG